MAKDPFAEPDDHERTVIRPNPGGRRGAAPAAPSYAPPAYEPGAPNPFGASAPYGSAPGASPLGVPQSAARGPAEPDAIALTGVNQLVALGTPLFALLGRIRNRAQHPDPEKLRQSVMAEVRNFENAALKAGEDAQKVKVARYALCATLDDVVLNTPWGEQSGWAMQSMVGTFHRETVGGDRFFDLLARLEQDPGTNIDLLEFLYMCLSLGFEGRLRVEQGGMDKHGQIRVALARIIRGQRGEFERDLSPRWKGLEKPYRILSVWKPVWITVGAMALILAMIFGGLSYLLNQRQGLALTAIATVEAAEAPKLLRRAPPPPPPPPQKVEVDKIAKLTTFLAPEINDKVVTILTEKNAIIIRLSGVGMFKSGSDKMNAEFEKPINRVAEALTEEKGHILIVGHSDSSPVGSGRFKSNEELSQARADAVLKMVAPVVGDPSRLLAEGRGAKEPIADNETREGRAANRRIEIMLVKGDAPTPAADPAADPAEPAPATGGN
ncbi:type IVB secretion system protein IcmH/DotU [Rhodobacter sp. KR11]|uniref:type IVB secretion system protein IcmH/DotU n=1 Tax=Rhodobacter sp. KR11 TaxID=2974588 RepID=UPI0022214C8A|nr:type IVB secretion system protein IcmH/DotU [Rhodobacter sp. KR11]MCW1917924.1 type IVB secretion system protein IcmH/DotU [Rhodobacter sp. KR11]